jgi:hypothetical protein
VAAIADTVTIEPSKIEKEDRVNSFKTMVFIAPLFIEDTGAGNGS